MSLPQIVTRAQWVAARESLLVEEKAVTRARDGLNARRRALPMVEVVTEYVFEGPDGKVALRDLFEDREQLVVYHFMFGPEQDTGCAGCSGFLDQIGNLAHLRARGTAFAAVSRAPFTKLLPFKARMGWTLPWYSSYVCDFNADFGATVPAGDRPVERAGVSCFLRHGERLFHTYSTFDRGLDGLGSTTSLLDLTALGRQEEWEEPRGRALVRRVRDGKGWLRHHDDYDD
ncbi:MULTISPECIES: DUF899 domain-containing protein [Streptomyces]|uniref:Thioredoxin n=1 Tax=Streptomyces uncialis TaxID=1048205 RepID=A0A1Q4V523_9ACTN|nr:MULTISPECIES: DUF899 domain-containing protein [Streptomyces]MCX4663155.1 DUF899 domain-containing protein [Streptomyces uncialis]MYY08411.1 DUF899 domain-containing protein [Streptomyces sp. SID4919]OKH92948.1 hypothetical protein AB852_20805 [Streptomyces uncialis]WTE10304.1 DUF899 domain-containing protein [Streptomyces uncialis]SCK48678.1 Predicted dithiol-disulfide oxidoreductase, DUF899 family [Streptomyces sp. AmelKG-E11A]